MRWAGSLFETRPLRHLHVWKNGVKHETRNLAHHTQPRLCCGGWRTPTTRRGAGECGRLGTFLVIRKEDGKHPNALIGSGYTESVRAAMEAAERMADRSTSGSLTCAQPGGMFARSSTGP